MWPSPVGAHSWQPMAYSPSTQLVYIPVIEGGANFSAGPITRQNWHRAKDGAVDGAVLINADIKDPLQWTSFLLAWDRSEEHTSELQSLMRISYAVFCLKKKQQQKQQTKNAK